MVSLEIGDRADNHTAVPHHAQDWEPSQCRPFFASQQAGLPSLGDGPFFSVDFPECFERPPSPMQRSIHDNRKLHVHDLALLKNHR